MAIRHAFVREDGIDKCPCGTTRRFIGQHRVYTDRKGEVSATADSCTRHYPQEALSPIVKEITAPKVEQVVRSGFCEMLAVIKLLHVEFIKDRQFMQNEVRQNVISITESILEVNGQLV
jgi:hypothetical protein